MTYDKDGTLYTKIDEILNSDGAAIDSMAESRAWVQGGYGYNITYNSSSVGDSTSITVSSPNMEDYTYYSNPWVNYKVSLSSVLWNKSYYYYGYPTQSFSPVTTLSHSFSFSQNGLPSFNYYASKKRYSWRGGFQLIRMCRGGSMAVVLLIGKTWMQEVDLYNQATNNSQKKQQAQDLCFAFSICFAKML